MKGSACQPGYLSLERHASTTPPRKPVQCAANTVRSFVSFLCALHCHQEEPLTKTEREKMHRRIAIIRTLPSTAGDPMFIDIVPHYRTIAASCSHMTLSIHHPLIDFRVARSPPSPIVIHRRTWTLRRFLRRLLACNASIALQGAVQRS